MYQNLQIALVVAVATNGIMGCKGQLPWHFPEDLKHFKSLTTGGIVVMGRVTYFSIPEDFRPLAERTSVVISGKLAKISTSTHNVQWCTNPSEALKWCSDNAKVGQTIWVIGGRRIFEAMLLFVTRAVITRIPFAAKGDVIFPPLPVEFNIVKSTKIDLTAPVEVDNGPQINHLVVEWYER